ncbi:hypothetical protein [Streptacidiphilus sp. P02-A3a]|uniref:hypothetical protein n=1 Tax=Streptacidiphilus sp. P02-A3a TaxID=2704468 RepID=UPI0015FDFE89|nr:hypothetical protein [Streptacidiphilus sp. P02-A3a]QMU67792.1 hypothetical protein GXP74_05670 [Streptacidiphilus sp. P02-A3a]
MNMRWGSTRKVAAGAAAVAVAVGLSLGLSGSAGAATVKPATAAAQQYVVPDCSGKAQVDPGTIVLACADYGLGLQALHWTSWTPQLASAYGTEWEKDCQPSCAAGHIKDYPVVIELLGSAPVKGHPNEHRYTEATITYTAARPPVYVKSGSKVVATYPISWTVPLAP